MLLLELKLCDWFIFTSNLFNQSHRRTSFECCTFLGCVCVVLRLKSL